MSFYKIQKSLTDDVKNMLFMTQEFKEHMLNTPVKQLNARNVILPTTPTYNNHIHTNIALWYMKFISINNNYHYNNKYFK